ncbi:MAG: PD-(D/E)XK nuclease family protein [Candidatus Omnitrophica bacterium]|nr:PD-(D/E)XK nuclease family protein [Candidatus Omnitrophota bacterium]
MKEISLSPSALNLFLDCPRCFWYEKVKSIKRPRGIFPSLPGGMDRVIKAYFDTFRGKNTLPAELSGDDFRGIRLFGDQEKLERWRNWRTGLAMRDAALGAVLSGALDDLLVKDGQYIPFDYKTKGSPTSREDAVKYYQNQMDCYTLLLEANGLPPAGFAFLLYYSPKTVAESGQALFEVQPIKISTQAARARATFERAVAFLSQPAPPEGACEYCVWRAKFKDLC